MVSSQLLNSCWKCKRNASKKWGKWKRKTKIAESWDRLQLLGGTPIRLLTGSSSYTHYDSLQLIENALSLNPSLFSTFSWYLFKKACISCWILLMLHNISRPLLMVDTSSLKGWLGVAVRPAGRLQPCQITAPPLRQIHEDRHRFVLFKDFNSQINIICVMMVNINFLQCNTTHKDKCMKMLALPKVPCPCFWYFILLKNMRNLKI